VCPIVCRESDARSDARRAGHFDRVLQLVPKHRNSSFSIEREGESRTQDAVRRRHRQEVEPSAEAPVSQPSHRHVDDHVGPLNRIDERPECRRSAQSLRNHATLNASLGPKVDNRIDRPIV